MFTLKFFILFLLAGLCFGDTSAGETASGNGQGEGEGESSGAAGNAEVGDTSAGQDNTGEKSRESGDDGKSKEGKKATAGHTLPHFIGSEKNKKDYVTKLVDLCITKHSINKINENNISFSTCTFSCLSSTPFVTSVNERIPEGMICNDKDTKCPVEGPCPPLPVPNC
uniref:Putative secreted salivary protein n=1 Tax=Ixodes scapularis TaxID=6945 RepID=Q4PMF1_IXOSC|nr:putative secreted salivary protein [Ixodes scapularis]